MRHYPAAYLDVPEYLEPVKPLPSNAEVACADEIRLPFVSEGQPAPYMVDVLRALRLLRGKERYVEVGTFDKGCLAYVASLLSPRATIVDVDLEPNPAATERLLGRLQMGQRLVTVVGDSTSPAVVEKVKAALPGGMAD